MENKVILICIDGMRADGFLTCGNPYAQELMRKGAYTVEGSSVFPSVTLPAHMSMFHSVPPERHGITTNVYMPMVRPVKGIGSAIKAAGGVSAMYYGWEPLRDIIRPGCLKYSTYINAYTEEGTDGMLTDAAMERIEKTRPDFVFLYMVETDEKGGHIAGWMSEDYLRYVSTAMDNAKRVIDAWGDEYTIILTADHGGHDRVHGTTSPEDMTVPMVFMGKRFTPGKKLENVSIMDITPTIADVMGISPDEEWEGRSVAE